MGAHGGQVVYRSYFAGTKAFYRHLQQYKTPKGYQGKVLPPRTVWDIDAEDTDELDGALADAKNLIRSLKAHDVPESAIVPWFSGNRGFHVEVPNLFGFAPKRNMPDEVRDTLMEFWPGADKKPMMQNGMIRARWSAHEKTDWFKVPFTVDELMSMSANQITHRARDPRRHDTGRKAAWKQIVAERQDPGPILADQRKTVSAREITATNSSGINRVEDDPSIKITCMHKLWNRGPKPGRRNSDIHEMVRAWRSQGIGSEQCIAMGWAWVKPHNRTTDDPMQKAEVQQIVYKVFKNGYTPACDRDVYEEFCDPKCIFYDKKDFGPKATALSDEADRYMKHKREGTSYVFNVNEVYPGINFSFRGGEVGMILGDTGTGKTALAMNWTVQLTDREKRQEAGKKPLRVFFNSPEMGMDSMMDRFLQIQYGLAVNADTNTDQIQAATEQGWLTRERVERAMNGIHMSTEALSTDEMYDTLGAVEPDVLVIDPLEDVAVEGGGYDKVADQKQLIQDLQRIGAKTDTAVLIIHHVNKGGMGNDEITMADGKGASAIPQKADFVFAFEGERMEDRRHLRLLKKRRNQSLDLHLKGDVDTFRFYNLSEHAGQETLAYKDEGDGATAADEPGVIPDGTGDSVPQDPENLSVGVSDNEDTRTDALDLKNGALTGLVDDADLR